MFYCSVINFLFMRILLLIMVSHHFIFFSTSSLEKKSVFRKWKLKCQKIYFYANLNFSTSLIAIATVIGMNDQCHTALQKTHM